MYRRTFAILISVLALAAVAAGCGEDESSSSSLTKAEFVKQGDAMCKEVNRKARNEVGAFLQKNSNGELPNAEQEVVLITTIIAPQLQKQVDGLNELGIPENDNGEIAKFVEEVESVADEAEEDPKAAISEGTPFEEAEDLAKPLGFEECGHN